jgi:hypothetical protein
MKLRALALGTALLAATVPSLSSSAEAAPWGWHGGGWGWGGVGLGLAAGAIIGGALAAPYYGYYAPAYYPSDYYDGYGYPAFYGYAPAVTYGYGYRHLYRPHLYAHYRPIRRHRYWR